VSIKEKDTCSKSFLSSEVLKAVHVLKIALTSLPEFHDYKYN